MKALLWATAAASMLAACSAMPGRDSGLDAGPHAQQSVGSSDMRYEWGRGAYKGPGGTGLWSGGDDTSGGLGWRRD